MSSSCGNSTAPAQPIDRMCARLYVRPTLGGSELLGTADSFPNRATTHKRPSVWAPVLRSSLGK